MNQIIYADNAATTKVSENVLEAMLPWYSENYGNPSSIYSIGRTAHIAVDNARRQVAEVIGCTPAEIFFTSGGTESDNWAIKGTAYRLKRQGKTHIITSNFEHHAVLHCCKALEKEGFTVTYLPINEKGFVTAQQVKDAITPETALVTIMYVNNEIGTIQPIKEIGAVCKEANVLLHTDAVQAMGHIPVNVEDENISLLSISGHKFHGPKGVGVLYAKRGTAPMNIIEGGGQEKGKRPGTENIAGIVGLATALDEAVKEMDAVNAQIQPLRDKLAKTLPEILPRVHVNGDVNNRVPNNINLSFEGVEGESLLMMLDYAGICGSSGSACTSGSLDPSHVLLALGLSHEIAHGSLRLSLSKYNTMEEIDTIIEKIPPIVERLRAMSPLWEKIVKETK